MNHPFFSIIIPTLNEEEVIGRLLKNLTRQAERDFEVHVVDGNSTDRTQRIVKSFETKIPVTFIASKIRNVSVQRNMGANQAQGEYLIFFDADVQIPPGYLFRLKRELIKKKYLLVSTYTRADSDNVYDKTIAQFTNYLLDVSTLVDRPISLGFDMIIHRKTFSYLGGFREDVVYAEDTELSERYSKSGCKMTVLKKPVLVFSLRRFRAEGRLAVLRKNAKAGLHLLTRGPITKDLFSYPMGGDWYKKLGNGKMNLTMFNRVRKTVIQFKRFITA